MVTFHAQNRLTARNIRDKYFYDNNELMGNKSEMKLNLNAIPAH